MISELGYPLVATSGNRSDEPICIDEHEALERLSGIADLFLIHNRPIARHVDDSIVRELAGRELVMRRARGFAPLPVYLKDEAPSVLGVGAHLKNAVALSRGNQAVTSQHIGDLETTQALEAFTRVIDDLSALYEIQPETVACDLHPDYLSTKYANAKGLPVVAVQHHYAHILSAMSENELSGEALGVSWDGTGFGLDKTIWGGEFLRITDTSFERFGYLRTFRLPGGERAITEPRRVALGVLYEIYGDDVLKMSDLPSIAAFTSEELTVMHQMLKSGLNSPVTSSAGRLFDAVSSILGLRQFTRYEGQAAMELEFALDGVTTKEAYPFGLSNYGNGYIVDWEQSVRRLINDFKDRVAIGLISARFHNTLAEIIVELAKRARQEKVVLSGGCFQNKYLTERSIKQLRDAGFRPYWHQRVPPNDGGIALGQIAAAARQKRM